MDQMKKPAHAATWNGLKKHAQLGGEQSLDTTANTFHAMEASR